MKTRSKTTGSIVDNMRFTVLLLVFIPAFTNAAEERNDSRRFELLINERKLQVESTTIRVTQGQTVELVWNSDEAGELHLHGYDINFRVSPETPAMVTFKAHASGRFPVTSHSFDGDHGHGHEALMYLEVYPD